jgi:adenylate cyclase
MIKDSSQISQYVETESALDEDTVALLFADIAGYSSLIKSDERSATLDIQEVFTSIIYPALSSHDGELIQLEGDGFFARFPDSTHALRFSKLLLFEMKLFNQHRPPSSEIEFRVGINYGKVFVDKQTRRLSGNAVNIASRLEKMADSGGVWVSESVVTESGPGHEFNFISLGSRRLKNIGGKFPVFGVTWDESNEQNDYEGYSKQAFPTINSTVAILPFSFGSDEKVDEFLGQAIVEDVMTDLGRFTEISILSPSSTAHYTSNVENLKETGRKLGVDYIVTGRVMHLGNRIKIYTRLFETDKGEQIWFGKYDEQMNDLFLLQERVAQDLASNLPLRIENDSLSNSKKYSFQSLDSFYCYLKGRSFYREKSAGTDREALKHLYRAIELDPEFPDPYTVVGAILGISWHYDGWGVNPADRILEGRKFIQKAISLNHNLPRAHAHLGWSYLITRDFDDAYKCFGTATSLNPNDADVSFLESSALLYMGQPSRSMEICKNLMKLNPKFPDWYYDTLGGAYFIDGQYQMALSTLKKVENLFPETKIWLASCQGHLGLHAEANDSILSFADDIEEVWQGPESSQAGDYLQWFSKHCCWFLHEENQFKLLDGLSKAGIKIS